MALFTANLVFSRRLIASAKMRILLASVFSAAAGIALLMRLPARDRNSPTWTPLGIRTAKGF